METLASHVEAAAAVPLSSEFWEPFCAAIETMTASFAPRATVSLRVVGDDEIRELNRRFRDQDQATDVLSFPTQHSSLNVRGKEPAGFLGDIALSWPAVERQALANGNSAQGEAAALFAHGLLHLAGYDHVDDAGQSEMDRLTRQLCAAAGFEVQLFGH